MAKLIVILIILGFFGGVIALVHFNYRREMRDRAEARRRAEDATQDDSDR